MNRCHTCCRHCTTALAAITALMSTAGCEYPGTHEVLLIRDGQNNNARVPVTRIGVPAEPRARDRHGLRAYRIRDEYRLGREPFRVLVVPAHLSPADTADAVRRIAWPTTPLPDTGESAGAASQPVP